MIGIKEFGLLANSIKYREFGYRNNSKFYRYLRFDLKSLVKFINIQKKDIYVSCAYKDLEDNWMGCDLFFDIDENNLTNAKLLAAILLGKFNLNNIEIIFSGNGYHVVCYDEVIRQLNSCDRRMIADYVNSKVNIDTVCTIDTNRLRRIPNSINSKGNRKTKIIWRLYSDKESYNQSNIRF